MLFSQVAENEQDNTGMNGIMLMCKDRSNGEQGQEEEEQEVDESVTSTVGPHGDWIELPACPTHGEQWWVVGYKLQVKERYYGVTNVMVSVEDL